MRSFCLRLCFLAALLPLPPGHALAETTWTEVRSPHFRVLTDASSKDARNVAAEFEQMRHIFVSTFNENYTDSGAPLTVVAARDANSYRNLNPALWKARNGNIAGDYHRGWEKQFATMRLDTFQGAGQAVVYHEYTHSILHANAHWLPTWLDEGMAEFYAYTQFRNDRTYIGGPSIRLRVLKDTPMLLPIPEMLAVNERSPLLRDPWKEQLFYGEAWAMVHYMVFGPGMNGGQKLFSFLKAVQTHTDQQKAFRDTFGDPLAFQTALSQYIARYTFSAAVLPPAPGIDPKTFTERKLTPAETNYELGCIRLGAHDRVAGRAAIEQALTLDPKHAGAHEELGFLDFEDGRDPDARNEWQQAITLDPTLPRSQFALLMSSTPIMQQSPTQLHTTQEALSHITNLAPHFAPAFVELALLEWQLGNLQKAYEDANHAEKLEPWRAGYHLLSGHILLEGGLPGLAADHARYVASQWFGSDHDEAVALWEAVPAAQRSTGPALTLDLPPGVQVVRGTLTSESCTTSPGPSSGPAHLTATLTPDDPSGAAPLTFSSDTRLRIGFSDTLWWGEDHFSACHHLAGHPAVALYKNSPSGSELVELEVRDDLPQTAPPAAAAPAQPGKAGISPTPPAAPLATAAH